MERGRKLREVIETGPLTRGRTKLNVGELVSEVSMGWNGCHYVDSGFHVKTTRRDGLHAKPPCRARIRYGGQIPLGALTKSLAQVAQLVRRRLSNSGTRQVSHSNRIFAIIPLSS
jgi:hypothetical protein